MRLNAAQIEPLTAGAHSDRNLFDLGRREQKFHMVGRLFQGFQETVESLFGEHMHFVDNIDFCACHDRLVACALDDLAHIIDPGMRGGVHFDDIDVARVRLIHDLHHAMAIAEETMPVVLSLLDQVYDLRGTLRDLLHALEAQPEDVRKAVLAPLRRG